MAGSSRRRDRKERHDEVKKLMNRLVSETGGRNRREGSRHIRKGESNEKEKDYGLAVLLTRKGDKGKAKVRREDVGVTSLATSISLSRRRSLSPFLSSSDDINNELQPALLACGKTICLPFFSPWSTEQ